MPRHLQVATQETLGGGQLSRHDIVTTDGTETDAERQKSEGFMCWIAGIQGNLDPSHLYYNL